MTDKRDVKLARKAREQKFEPVTVAFTGKIVSRNGSVAVPGVFNHVWVLATDTAEPEAVYNRRVKDTRPGLPVVVGYAPKSKTLEILQTDVEHLAGFYETGGLDTQRHADTHLDTGDDPVYVNRRMITDQLYVAPGSGLAVNVSPYEYDVDGVRKYFPGQNNYSLAASKPAAGLARYVLVYLDKATNALGVVDGPTVPDLDWFIPAKPDTPAGGEAAAYVRLDGTQTGFSQADIADGRRLFGGGGGGGFNFPKIKTVASSGADYTSIKTALSAVLAGTVVLQMETVTEDGFTVGADRSVQNLSPSEFMISVPNGVSLDADTVYGVRVTPGGNIFEANIFCSHNATNTYGLYLLNATVERVFAEASGGTNRYGIVIEENSTLNELLFCQARATGGVGQNIGLWVQENAAVLRVLGGQYEGSTADIRVSAGASVELQGPTLVHGTIDNDGGTVTGWWYDADSNLHFAPGSGLQGGVWLHKADGMQLWYADLDSAIDAAGSFEGVEFVHDLELAGLEIDKPVVLRGNNHIITSTGVELAAGIAAGCSITASAMIEDVQVDSTSTETNNIGISIDSSPTLKRVAAMASDGTNRFGGFTEVGDEAILEDCDFSARDGTVNYGLWTNGARIIRGRYEGSDADIYVATGASVRLEGPVLTNGLLVLDSGASWTGWYYDGNGNVIRSSAGDVYPNWDGWGLFKRHVNFGRTPQEHWPQGADQLAWLGWATYAGYGTPATIIRTESKLTVTHTGALKVFYYRAYVNNQTAIFAACGTSLAGETGLRVDDGTLNNYVQIFVEYTTGTNNANLAFESRVGAGAVTKTTALSLPPQDLYGISIQYGLGTRWSNWTAQARVFGTAGNVVFVGNIATGLAWTPARHGLYGSIGVVNRTCVWDWFEET